MSEDPILEVEYTCLSCGTVYYAEYPFNPTKDGKALFPSQTIQKACPECGTTIASNIPDLESDGKGGLKQLFTGPEFTPAVLGQLKTLAEEALATPEIAANFAEQVNKIVPSLGDKLEVYLGTRKNTIDAFSKLIQLLTLMLATVAFVKSKQAPAPVTNNYYAAPIASPLSASQTANLRRIQNAPSTRGSNSTPPKKKKPPKRK
jgi:hypothetical protein